MKFVLAVCFLLAALCGRAQECVLRGKIVGARQPDKVSVTLFGPLSGKDFHEIPVKNGAFELRGILDHPCMALIRTENIAQEFGLWLENTTIDAVFEVYAPGHTPGMEMLATQSAEGSPDVVFYTGLYNRLKKANEDTSLPARQKLEALRSSIEQHIARHPDSYLSLHLTDSFMDDQAYGLDWGRKHLSMLDQKLLQSEPGRNLQRKLQRMETNGVGDQVADFRLPDSEGRVFSLSSSKAEYVLLEFWSSWCKPCRAQNPELVKLHTAYKAKGLEIIGVSLDDNEEAWKKAIAKDGLAWLQLCDFKGWQGPVAKRFSLAGIPYNLLLDRNRRIVAVDLQGPDLEAELKKRLAP